MTDVLHIGSRDWRRTPAFQKVFVGRPSKWGNPFVIGTDGDRATVIAKYRAHLRERPELVAAARVELRGKSLGCYCAPLLCHGDVLAAVAEGAEP